jgi:hypothetical protein
MENTLPNESNMEDLKNLPQEELLVIIQNLRK